MVHRFFIKFLAWATSISDGHQNFGIASIHSPQKEDDIMIDASHRNGICETWSAIGINE
jgi:hypothetical protein